MDIVNALTGIIAVAISAKSVGGKRRTLDIGRGDMVLYDMFELHDGVAREGHVCVTVVRGWSCRGAERPQSE